VTPGERIAAIRDISAGLAQQPWHEINLVLEQFNFSTGYYNDWADAPRDMYVQSMVKSMPDDELETLLAYVRSTSVADGVVTEPPAGVWPEGNLRLFLSHLSVHKAEVHEVGEGLKRYGIHGFVAHDSIEPTRDWQDVIEGALRTCEAAVFFLHDGFRESSFCDQEVGFILAQRVPYVALQLGTAPPHGFLGRHQGAYAVNQKPFQLRDTIVNVLASQPQLETPMTEGLVRAFCSTGSWDNTRKLWPLVSTRPNFTPDQMRRLIWAAETNVDIYDAALPSGNGKDEVLALVRRHGGSTEPVPPQGH
jgi:hypothetical protein